MGLSFERCQLVTSNSGIIRLWNKIQTICASDTLVAAHQQPRRGEGDKETMQRNSRSKNSETRSETRSPQEATMKRTLLTAAIMAALIGVGTANAQPATPQLEGKSAITIAGAPVEVYWTLAGVYLAYDQNIKEWGFVCETYSKIDRDLVPEAIAELNKASKESVKSVTIAFASAAQFAGAKREEYIKKLSLLYGFELTMKKLSCSRSNEGKLAETLVAKTKAEAEVSAIENQREAQNQKDELEMAKVKEAIDAQKAKVDALKTEVDGLNKTITAKKVPKGTPKEQFKAAKQNAKDTLPAKQEELKAAKAELAKLDGGFDQKDLAEIEAKLTSAKEQLAKIQGEFKGVSESTVWSCVNNADQAILDTVSAYTAKRPDAEKQRVQPWLDKASKATSSDMRALLVWRGMAELPPEGLAFLTTPSDLGIRGLVTETDSSKVPSGEPRINLNPDGAAVDIASKTGDRVFAFEPSFLDSLGLSGESMFGDRVFNKTRAPKWNKLVPPLHLSILTAFFSGDSTDTRHGRDFNVKAVGYSVGMSLGVEGVIKRWNKSIAMFYGADLGLGFRKTLFRDETVANPASSSFVFGNADLRMGVNFKGWTSVYALASLRLPLGGAVGGGLELTGFGPARIAVEGLYDLSRNNANTGVAGSHPADFSGPSIRTVIGLVF